MTEPTTPAPLSPEREAEIRARAADEHLTPGPWRLDRESCDCGGDYPCGHGMYVTGIVAPTPTWAAAERLKRTGEQPRDYDFHRSEICEFTGADWELMAHARADVPVLLAELDRVRADRDAFADRVETLTAVAKSNKRHVQTMHADLQKAQRERDDLTKRVAELDRSETQLIGERDHMHDVADQLAYAIAPIEVIGEHSSENDPWQNALDHVTPAAQVDEEKQRVAEVLRIVSAWCTEANDVGGVDAGDLAWRLEQAGHQLPDEETAAPAEGSDH
ncbi:hypothetical protein [Streptomyces malaysiensis]|uniref:hypothetical protein n=1 Tax=Streptomyces malaysiensis TaxID=92644 RepID=UPI0032200070|nr:hypothetical protein [Streptomyces malaysiensis]